VGIWGFEAYAVMLFSGSIVNVMMVLFSFRWLFLAVMTFITRETGISKHNRAAEVRPVATSLLKSELQVFRMADSAAFLSLLPSAYHLTVRT